MEVKRFDRYTPVCSRCLRETNYGPLAGEQRVTSDTDLLARLDVANEPLAILCARCGATLRDCAQVTAAHAYRDAAIADSLGKEAAMSEAAERKLCNREGAQRRGWIGW